MVRAVADGEVMLGGLFPVHQTTNEEPDNCSVLCHATGIERLEAMLFTIDEINGNDTLLPGVKLGANIFDTCCMANVALERSLEFTRGSLSTLDASEFYCDDGSTPKPRAIRKPVAGVIGPGFSSVSVPVASLLRLFKVPQVSYAATSTSLSDKSLYEYFVRTVPPDILQAMAFLDILQAFKWTYVSTVQSDGEYGESAMDYFRDEARARNICIAVSVEIPQTADSVTYDEIVTEIMRKEKAHVVIAFAKTEDVVGLLDAVSRRNSSRRPVFVASETWGNRLAPVTNNQLAAQGAITLVVQSTPIQKFEDYFLGLDPITNTRNPWYKKYWEEVHQCRWNQATGDGTRRCTGKEKINRTLDHQEAKVQFVYDAVYALAIALHRMMHDHCGSQSWKSCKSMHTIDGERLLKDYLLNISFTGK